MSKVLTVYIAGKVTNLPYYHVRHKFEAAARQIAAKGHAPINPIQVVNNHEAPWEMAMRKCIAALAGADAILMLPCWRTSPGAIWELEIAKRLGLTVYEAGHQCSMFCSPFTGGGINHCLTCGHSDTIPF